MKKLSVIIVEDELPAIELLLEEFSKVSDIEIELIDILGSIEGLKCCIENRNL